MSSIPFGMATLRIWSIIFMASSARASHRQLHPRAQHHGCSRRRGYAGVGSAFSAAACPLSDDSLPCRSQHVPACPLSCAHARLRSARALPLRSLLALPQTLLHALLVLFRQQQVTAPGGVPHTPHLPRVESRRGCECNPLAALLDTRRRVGSAVLIHLQPHGSRHALRARRRRGGGRCFRERRGGASSECHFAWPHYVQDVSGDGAVRHAKAARRFHTTLRQPVRVASSRPTLDLSTSHLMSSR